MSKTLSALISRFAVVGAAAVVLALTITALAASAASGPSATTGAVTATYPTSAVATGTVNPNGVATSYYFEYGPGRESSFAAKTVQQRAGSGAADVAVSMTIAGLSPATSYHYRLVASNDSGITDGAS